MKKSIKVMLAGLLAVPMLALGVSVATPVAQTAFAVGTIQDGASDARATSGQSDNLFGEGGVFRTITDAALYIIGAVSVLMLIYGGIRYTLSAGNEKDVTAAKNTILYAIIGIIVALMAYAIVHWVIGTLIGGGN